MADGSPRSDPAAQSTARGLWVRRLLTVTLVLTLVSPAIRNEDSLPLSTYPMYSGARSNVSSFVTASGVDQLGNRTTLSAVMISGSRDRLIAQSFLNDTVSRGGAVDLCSAIAARAALPLVEVQISREQHDTIARLRGTESLLEREVIVTCEVVGR